MKTKKGVRRERKAKKQKSGKRETRSRGEGAKCETHGPAHKMGTKETS